MVSDLVRLVMYIWLSTVHMFLKPETLVWYILGNLGCCICTRIRRNSLHYLYMTCDVPMFPLKLIQTFETNLANPLAKSPSPFLFIASCISTHSLSSILISPIHHSCLTQLFLCYFWIFYLSFDAMTDPKYFCRVILSYKFLLFLDLI